MLLTGHKHWMLWQVPGLGDTVSSSRASPRAISAQFVGQHLSQLQLLGSHILLPGSCWPCADVHMVCSLGQAQEQHLLKLPVNIWISSSCQAATTCCGACADVDLPGGPDAGHALWWSSLIAAIQRLALEKWFFLGLARPWEPDWPVSGLPQGPEQLLHLPGAGSELFSHLHKA